MRTRRSWRNQDRLYKSIGRDLARAAAQRTTVTLIAAGPDGADYGVYRAIVRNPDQRWSWDAHKAQHITTIHVGADETRPSYKQMAESYATPEWPALAYPEERT